MGSDATTHALVLGFDTSASHCAGALLRDGKVLTATSEEMGRGQAERLIPLLQELLAQAGVGWSGLDAIGVGTGPGNFTGIRISVAAARGLALSLGIPAYGVDTFAASELGHDGPGLPSVPAPRGQVYVRPPGAVPRVIQPDDAAALGLPVLSRPPPVQLAENIARIAAAGRGKVPPAPIYVRPADAAPSKTPPPPILDGSPAR